MSGSELGKEFRAGEIIVKQGEIGDFMYVIQSGTAEVIQNVDGKETHVANLVAKDIFGEMSISKNKPGQLPLGQLLMSGQ